MAAQCQVLGLGLVVHGLGLGLVLHGLGLVVHGLGLGLAGHGLGLGLVGHVLDSITYIYDIIYTYDKSNKRKQKEKLSSG